MKHPSKCLAVKGRRDTSRGAHALMVYDCPDDLSRAERFIINEQGRGYIRWALHPDLCLNAPGGSGLQFWKCKSAPEMNLNFEIQVSSNGSSEIRKASDPRWCVDIPNEDHRNGNRLQMWYCNSTRTGKPQDEQFSFHRLVDCKYNEYCGFGPDPSKTTVATTTPSPTTSTTLAEPGDALDPYAAEQEVLMRTTTTLVVVDESGNEIDLHASQDSARSLGVAIPGSMIWLLGCCLALGAILAAPFLYRRLSKPRREGDGAAIVWHFGRVVDARRPYDTLNGAYEVQLDGRSSPGSARDASLVYS
jgi:hypothetical protein